MRKGDDSRELGGRLTGGDANAHGGKGVWPPYMLSHNIPCHLLFISSNLDSSWWRIPGHLFSSWRQYCSYTFSFIEYYFFALTLFFLTNLVFFLFNHLRGSQLSPLQSLTNDQKDPLGSYLGLHYLYSDRLIHSFKTIADDFFVKRHSSLTLRDSNILVGN